MNSDQLKKKKAYTKPTLEKFGSVSAVTAGGSGAASENNQGGAKPRV